MKRQLISLMSLVLVLLCAPLFTLSKAGAVSGGVGGRPANPNPQNPRTDSIFIFSLEPGEETQDEALVSNNSGETKTVDVYAVDAITTNNGSLSCKQKAEASDGVGSWIRVDDPEVSLTTGSNQRAGFTVRVPANASPGEHNGCLVFQAQEAGVPADSGNITIRTRQAVRVAITVPGDLHKALRISSFGVEQTNRKQVFNLAVANEGNVSVDAQVHVSLRSVFGNEIFDDGGGYPVLPGKTLDLRFQNENVPIWGGWYKARAVVSYDTRPETFGMSEDATVQQLEAADVWVFVQPQPQVLFAGLAIIVLGSGIFLVVRRRTAKQKVK